MSFGTRQKKKIKTYQEPRAFIKAKISQESRGYNVYGNKIIRITDLLN